MALKKVNIIYKRMFDVIFSAILIFLLSWLIFIAFVLASLDTKSFGIFSQKRVGLNGKLFSIYKIKTMLPIEGFITSVTSSVDPRITKLGSFFRLTKIDELPQLFNILIGDMSFVGPRPDVVGFADRLEGKYKDILSIRPGITGPASLKYRNEADILAGKDDPDYYNLHFIWPDKVKINYNYIQEWTFLKDIKYLLKTILFI